MPSRRAAATLPGKSSRKTACSGAMPPSSRSASEKIAGSGLRTPTSLESITASNSSAIGISARQPARELARVVGDERGAQAALAQPARRRDHRLARAAAARHAREDRERVEREPGLRRERHDRLARVEQRDLAALEAVPGVVGVAVVGAEHEAEHAFGRRAELGRGLGEHRERRRRVDAAEVEQDRANRHRIAHAITR